MLTRLCHSSRRFCYPDEVTKSRKRDNIVGESVVTIVKSLGFRAPGFRAPGLSDRSIGRSVDRRSEVGGGKFAAKSNDETTQKHAARLLSIRPPPTAQIDRYVSMSLRSRLRMDLSSHLPYLLSCPLSHATFPFLLSLSRVIDLWAERIS